MATVKKSKKRIIVPICIVLVIAIIAGTVFGIVKSKSGEEVSLYTIGTGDIYENVSLTGDVTAGAVKEYKVGTVATVKEVFVKVGDKVKKDDILATFDTTQLDSQISSVQQSYNESLSAYNKAVKQQKNAASKANELASDIKSLENQVSKLEKQPKTTKKRTTITTVKTTARKTTKRTTNYTVKPITKPTTKATEKPTETTQPTTQKPVVKPTVTAPTTRNTTVDISGKLYVDAAVAPTNSYGTVSGIGYYDKDSSVKLTAKANAGYSFDGWYENYSDVLIGKRITSSETYEFKVTANTNLVAYFRQSNNPNITTEPTTAPTTTVPVGENIKEMADQLKTLNETLKTITNDLDTLTKLMEIVSTSIGDAIASGQLSSDAIAEIVAADVADAIQSGIIDSANLLVESGAAVKMIEAAVAAIDFQGIVDTVVNSNNVSLTAAQLQLAATYAQYELYNAQADGTVVNAQNKALKATKTALDALKTQQEEMKDGWKAAFDGVITKVDINDGAQTTALSAGITLENLDKMVVTVSLGEYDVHKVRVGMPATVTTAYGKYEAEVASIAPTASGGSSSSILDNVGSMAGISGLSSLTESGAGVQCEIAINETDENIIAGFNADVEISTGEYLGVVVVPIESITLEKTGSYVYIYDEEESTVTKTQIKTGAISDSSYEVTSGLKVGDKIVATPSTDYEEDSFKVKVVDKK